ncbi:hypothetical protein [Archaeoglobus veneficus]|uniref:Uncharacterized protein n=1 Tax=Archaeoglobus veneficus (strain DSM 11195 / SNP6) TaxID=693661 RepID=F2KRG0_ARCVS|nr:hypothetical protein [Archaeoglobus veneficus]AEA47894.1 hypothetical protein Arcve_1901 [Archaeoglobus veneficus SNP6]
MEENLNQIIRSNVAIKAIKHVVQRAEQFNNEYFPVKIEEIGIGGSSIRIDKPKDIDVFVKARAINSIWKEFFDFRTKTMESFHIFANAVLELTEEKGKSNIFDLIELIRDDLAEKGFKEDWIENWLPWVRVSDIRRGMESIIHMVLLDVEKLLERYLKKDWRGKRIEIHSTIIDPEGHIYGWDIKVPFLTIWTINGGWRLPDEDEIFEFFKKERLALLEIFEKVIALSKEVPDIYNQTIRMLEDSDGKFANTRKALSVLAVNVLKESLDFAVKKDIPESITILRQGLKRFALYGNLYYSIRYLELYKLLNALLDSNPKKKLVDVLHGKLKRDGYWRTDVQAAIENLELKNIYLDLKELAKEFPANSMYLRKLDLIGRIHGWH